MEARTFEKSHGTKHVNKLPCSLDNLRANWEQGHEFQQLKWHRNAFKREGFGWRAFCSERCKLFFILTKITLHWFSITDFYSKLMKQQQTFNITCSPRREWRMHKKRRVNKLFSKIKKLCSAHKGISKVIKASLKKSDWTQKALLI